MCGLRRSVHSLTLCAYDSKPTLRASVWRARSSYINGGEGVTAGAYQYNEVPPLCAYKPPSYHLPTAYSRQALPWRRNWQGRPAIKRSNRRGREKHKKRKTESGKGSRRKKELRSNSEQNMGLNTCHCMQIAVQYVARHLFPDKD